MSEKTEVDLNELNERLKARRAALPARTASPATEAAGSTNSTAVTCPRCHSVRQIAVSSKLFAVPSSSLCDGCVEAIETERREAAERVEVERRKRRVANRRDTILDALRESGVNVWDHRDATMDTFDASESGTLPLAAAAEFLESVRTAGKYDQVRGLYLFGDTGSGKSHLAVAIARELLLDPDISPTDVVFDHALRLIGRIQRTYSNEESADEVLNRRINAKLWILDDIGTEAPSADVVRRLTEIFTERAMRPTLVTSNLPPDKLEGRHAEFFRVVSRMGPRYFRTVRVKGSDRRFLAA